MGDPIRVLHAVVNMNRGGAETLIMNLYRNIDRSRIQFDFLTCKEGVFDSEIVAMGGRIHRVPYVSEVGHFGYVRALDEFFRTHSGYRIVHGHMDRMSGLVLYSAKRAGVPVRIAHSHNTRSEGGVAARVYKRIAGSYIPVAATHRLACSEAAARWLYGGRTPSAEILMNGIDSKQFEFSPKVRSEVREELGVSPDCYLVGHVGRFVPQKNHRFLLEAFREILDRIPAARLVLAGDGPLRTPMEQMAAAMGVGDRIRFLGIRSDVDRLLQAFDVFAFPSLHEGLPVTLVEAQGSGLPCVISDSITPEVDLGGGLVAFFPLNDRQAFLGKLMEAYGRRGQRFPAGEALARKGYDIQRTAVWAADYYHSISRCL